MNSRSYDEIVGAMNAKFAEESGYEAAEASDIGIRFKVLAGEILSLEKSLDWLENQMYADTACGEYLDRHAAEHGVTRKPAVKAKGQLEFRRSAVLTYDILIPAGTVCAAADNGAAEYATTEDCCLLKNSTSAFAQAEAVTGGAEYNCAVGKITALVTVPDGIEKVSNSVAFSGGRAREEDEALRKRVIAACTALPDGVNCEYYKRAALGFDGVGSAGVVPRINGSGSVGVYLWGESDAPTASVIKTVKDYLADKREINVEVTVAAAQKQELFYTVYISPQNGIEFESARVMVQDCISGFFSALQVGDAVYKAAVVASVLANCPVKNCVLPSGISDFNGSGDKIPVLAELTIKELV